MKGFKELLEYADKGRKKMQLKFLGDIICEESLEVVFVGHVHELLGHLKSGLSWRSGVLVHVCEQHFHGLVVAVFDLELPAFVLLGTLDYKFILYIFFVSFTGRLFLVPLCRSRPARTLLLAERIALCAQNSFPLHVIFTSAVSVLSLKDHLQMT